MKKIAIALALVASILVPTNAQAAQATFMGGPLTNLDSPASIHIALGNFPANGGLYIMQCVEGVSGARPSPCNTPVQLWVSTSPGASFLPTADIMLKPTSKFTGADCTVVKCGIFIRYDHTVPNDLSQDQFIPLTFKAGTTTTVALPNDEISATINGEVLSSKTPIKLGYRAPALLNATSNAGATLTYQSLAPACSLTGMKITALKGTGFCDIAVTSAGNATTSGITSHFPIELTLGVQTIPAFKVVANKKITLPKRTNFGELVTYLGTGSCTTTKNVVTAKKGTCTIVAGARSATDLYEPLNLRLVLKVK
jgi:hypothetical protein